MGLTDIRTLLSTNIVQALKNANSPSALNPFATLADIGGGGSGWSLNGNTNGVLKYIGTNDAFDFPIYVNGGETFRFLQTGSAQLESDVAGDLVLTVSNLHGATPAMAAYQLASNAAAQAFWQISTGDNSVGQQGNDLLFRNPSSGEFFVYTKDGNFGVGEIAPNNLGTFFRNIDDDAFVKVENPNNGTNAVAGFISDSDVAEGILVALSSTNNILDPSFAGDVIFGGLSTTNGTRVVSDKDIIFHPAFTETLRLLSDGTGRAIFSNGTGLPSIAWSGSHDSGFSWGGGNSTYGWSNGTVVTTIGGGEASLLSFGRTNDNTDFSFRSINSASTDLFAVRNDGRTAIGTLSFDPNDMFTIKSNRSAGDENILSLIRSDNLRVLQVNSYGNIFAGVLNADIGGYVGDNAIGGQMIFLQQNTDVNVLSNRYADLTIGAANAGYMRLWDGFGSVATRISAVASDDSYINNGGNFGIGTSSPAAPLDVNGKIYSRTGGVFTDTIQNYSGGDFVANSAANFVFNAAGDYIFNASGERVRIVRSNGYVGLNTASPTATLHVVGATADNTAFAFKVEDSSTSSLLCIRNDGFIGINTTTPDYKLTVVGGARFENGNAAALVINPTAGVSIQTTDAFGALTVNGDLALRYNGGSQINFVRAGNVGGNYSAFIYDDGAGANTLKLWNSGGYVSKWDLNNSYFGFGGGITPAATVDILGTFKYTSGNQGANKVLTSDASGNADWQAPTNGLVAHNDLTAQTGAVASITSYLTTTTTTFRVGGYINVTAVLTDVIQLQVTYTDENGTVQTEVFSSNTLSGSVSAIGNFPMLTMDIRVLTGTTITIKSVLTTGIGTITYDVGGNIIQLY